VRHGVLIRLTLCCILLWGTTAVADILHLKGGGEIETSNWWKERGMLVYETPAGVIGIPLEEILRIEPTAGPVESTEPAAPTPEPAVVPPVAKPQNQAVLLFQEGKTALESRDYETAAERFLASISRNPNIPAARVGYAVSVFSMNRDGLALSVILEGLSLQPDSAALHEVFGDLRNREERVDDAMRSWKKAFKLAPNDRLRDKIEKAQRELTAGSDYSFSTTPHFNVRYGDGMDPRLAAEIVDYLEEQYWFLADALMHAPEQPITVLLYPEQEFRDVTQAPEQVAGLFDGKIRVPLGGLTRIDPRARKLLVHELTHAVIHSKTRRNCPRWLHEGLAQRFEERPMTRADKKGVLKLFEGIAPHRWESRGFSYPAALSLVQSLETIRGLGGLVQVLDRLAAGDKIEQALETVYRSDYGSLCRSWSEQLAEK
jgi:tetratricopeptide (TPR) repeat protein